MADQFNRNHERRQCGHGSGKVLQVADSCVLESLSLVIHERTNSAAQGDNGYGGRRLEARNNADQIAEQNEEAERGQERSVAFTVMADDFITLVLNESFDTFEHMLERSGTIHGKAGPNQKEQN